MQRIVWMESMTTRSGFSFSIRPQISSTSFSAARKMLSCGTFSRAARSLTCRTDSSPVIYKTLCWLEMAPHSCRSIVDLPTPGSPLKSTTPPSTMPPPSTRSSSEMPVRIRLFSSVMLISERRFAVRVVTPSGRAAAACLAAAVPALGASATTSSFIVFQLPQLGQRPIQRGLVSPQLEHTYTVFSFGSFIKKAPVTLSWLYYSLL